MIVPLLVAAGTFVAFVARQRPRAGFAWAAIAYFGLTRVAEPQLRRPEALLEPASLFVAAAWSLVGCVAFVPALRRAVWTRWAFLRARRLALQEGEDSLADFAPWEHQLDSGRASAAIAELLADLGPGPSNAGPKGPRRGAGAPDPVDAALADDESFATSTDPGSAGAHGRHARAWSWARSNHLLGLELPSDWAGHGLDASECAAAVRRATSRSVERGLALALANLGSVLGLVLRYGSAQQRAHWVSRLASGEDTGAIAWIGAHPGASPLRATLAGADASATSAPTLRLDGSLVGIPFPVVPTVLALVVTVEDPSGQATWGDAHGATVLLVPTSTAGVRVELTGANEDSMPTVSVELSGATLPIDGALGGAEQLGFGLDAVLMARGVQRAVTLAALAAGLAQREARLVSSVECVAPAGAGERHAQEHLARIAIGVLRLNALSRATAAAAGSRILASSETEAVVGASRAELSAVLDSSDALLTSRPHLGAALTLREERSTILAAFALMESAGLDAGPGAGPGAGGSAAVTRERAAALADDIEWFDLERTAQAGAAAATSAKALWGACRRLAAFPQRAADLDAALGETIEIFGWIAAAVARGGGSSAPTSEASLALGQARRILTAALQTSAVHAADDRQSSDGVVFHAAQVHALRDALEALRSAASALPRRATRAVAPIAIAGVRRRLVRITTDDGHVARALVENRETRARLTRDVHAAPSVAAWDKAASIASTARAALHRLERAQDRGQLPSGEVRGLLGLAVDRGIVSERERCAIEERQRGPRAIHEAVGDGAASSSRAIS